MQFVDICTRRQIDIAILNDVGPLLFQSVHCSVCILYVNMLNVRYVNLENEHFLRLDDSYCEKKKSSIKMFKNIVLHFHQTWDLINKFRSSYLSSTLPQKWKGQCFVRMKTSIFLISNWTSRSKSLWKFVLSLGRHHSAVSKYMFFPYQVQVVQEATPADRVTRVSYCQLSSNITVEKITDVLDDCFYTDKY